VGEEEEETGSFDAGNERVKIILTSHSSVDIAAISYSRVFDLDERSIWFGVIGERFSC